jgi:hypothetical protein
MTDVPVPLLAPVVLFFSQSWWLVIQHHFLFVDFNMVSTVIIILTFVIDIVFFYCRIPWSNMTNSCSTNSFSFVYYLHNDVMFSKQMKALRYYFSALSVLVIQHHFLFVDFNMVSTVIIILTFVIAVYCHECKDFKLSASDQSVIDMMKHYLHTSRRTAFMAVNSNNKRQNYDNSWNHIAVYNDKMV